MRKFAVFGICCASLALAVDSAEHYDAGQLGIAVLIVSCTGLLSVVARTAVNRIVATIHHRSHCPRCAAPREFN